MNVAKRIVRPCMALFLLMALFLAFGNTPVQCAVQYDPLSDFEYEIVDGKISIIQWNGTATEVKIAPSYTIEGTEYPVAIVGESAFEARETLTYAELPATLERIGEYAFYDCMELKTVVVKGTQTEIGIGSLGLYYISRREDGIVADFVLEGYEGSTAAAYAAENGLAFRALESDPVSCGGITYASLAEAAAAVKEGSTLQLHRDIEESPIIRKNLTLDLNGCRIEGRVTVATGYTLTVKDSSTDDFTAEGCGLLTARGNVRAADGYLEVEQEDGTSYHRLDLQISFVNLRPSTVGIYYTGNFGGDEAIKAQIATYGTALSLTGVPTAEEITADQHYTKHTAFSADSWVCGEAEKAHGTLLKGIWKETNDLQTNQERANITIYSAAYVQLTDGNIILGEPVSMSLREVVEKVDARWDTLDAQQIAGMKEMYAKYEAIMEGWNIPNLIDTTDKMRIYSPSVTTVAGKTVTVTVNVRNNPGILGMLLSMEYDESVLTLTETASGSALAALTYVEPSRLRSGCNFLWYGNDTGTVIDGDLLTLTFQVAENATAGTYPIALNYSSQDTYDANDQPIAAVVINGSVIVKDTAASSTHTVIFKDHDGTVLKTEKVETGKAATAPAVPVREGYVFQGWDKPFHQVISDLTVTALYKTGEAGVKLVGTNVTAAAGDTVTVTVDVKNNPGILGMLLSLEYDESVLTLVGTASGSALAKLTYMPPSRLISGCNFLWYGSDTGTVTDGPVLTLTFKVAAGAAAGTYPITLNYSSSDTYDASYQPIAATVEDATVVVK